MIDLVIVCVGLISILIARMLLAKLTSNVFVVHAGKPDANKANIRKVMLSKNRPIYKNEGTEVDVSNLTSMIVDGHSLEPLGIKDNSTIYVEKKDNICDDELESLIGRFIVLKIDNDRALREHPLDVISVIDGMKARKVIDIVSTKCSKSEIKTKIENIMELDSEFSSFEKTRKTAFVEKIIQKYIFASDYYNKENNLIMSVTYKDGKEKDLSFHSSKFLYGVVRYNSI